MKDCNKAKIMLICSMIIFGTIGIFRRYIPLPSGMIAMSRGFIGMLFLIFVLIAKRERISFHAIGKNLLMLCISGALLGFNWILLFEAYRYTSVAVATLCYYMAPVFVIVASPFVFGEKLTWTKLICVIAALFGMVLVSGVLGEGVENPSEMRGIFLGLGAALLYACIVMLNKRNIDVAAYDKTIVQLGVAGVVLVPYTLIAESTSGIEITAIAIIMLIVIGVLHTGIAYALYFGSISKLKAQTAAIFSYIDPVVAVLLSVLLLGEKIGISGYIGAALILGAAILSEKRSNA